MESWEDRFIREYKDLKMREERLSTMLYEWRKGTLDFTPKCSYDLLHEQKIIMNYYLDVLVRRAAIEGISLPE